MRIPTLLLATLVTCSCAFAQAPAPEKAPDGKPEFGGMLVTGGETRYMLSIPGVEHGRWLAIGGSIGGWTLAEYRTKEGTLVLHKEGSPNLELALAGSRVTPGGAKATLADAQALFDKMNFSRIFEKMMEQQRAGMGAMVKQLTGGKAPPGVSPETFAEQQQKLMDTVFSEMSAKDFEADMAKVYSEVFTKDELDSVADFYGTPAGQALLAKTPELQQKAQAAMMPRIMAAMPKVQQLARQFAQENMKAAAAAGAAQAPAADKQP
jgi:hypothetical protein